MGKDDRIELRICGSESCPDPKYDIFPSLIHFLQFPNKNVKSQVASSKQYVWPINFPIFTWKFSQNVSRGKGCCKIAQLAGIFRDNAENTIQKDQLQECNNKPLPHLCNFYVTPFVFKPDQTQGWHAEFIDIGFDNKTRYGFIRNCIIFLFLLLMIVSSSFLTKKLW